MNTDDHVRLVLWLPRALHGALKRAAVEVGEPMPDALRARLASSLTLSQTAGRSGCAGRGEVAPPASPRLGAVGGRS